MKLEHTLDQFPAWVQTVAYIIAAVGGLGIASHGYFKALFKKMIPAAKIAEEKDAGKVISSIMVLDRAAITGFTECLMRVDTTLRSIQDDLHRGHDRSDKARDQMEHLIELLDKHPPRNVE